MYSFKEDCWLDEKTPLRGTKLPQPLNICVPKNNLAALINIYPNLAILPTKGRGDKKFKLSLHVNLVGDNMIGNVDNRWLPAMID